MLEQEGVAPIDALGKEFDPHVHEAVMSEDGEGNTDVVVEEFQKGLQAARSSYQAGHGQGWQTTELSTLQRKNQEQ